MLEERDLKIDLLALGLLALTIFLAASLLSYDPADPPSRLVYPERSETANVCGRFGALAGTVLLSAFGLGAYYLLVSLAVLDSLLLARRPIGEPVLRAAGWLLSLAGFSTLAAMAAPRLSPGPVIGSGGYLGAAVGGVLEANFASTGGLIVVLSLIAGGLLLCTDYVLFRALAWVAGSPIRTLGRGLLWVVVAYGGALQKQSGTAEAPDTDETDEPSEPVSVRIGRRAADEEPEAGEDETPDHLPGHEAGEEDADPDPPAPSRSLWPLRVRKPSSSPREQLLEEIEAASTGESPVDYELPSADLLLEAEPFCFDEHEKEVRRKAKVLEKTFADFGFHIRVVEIQTGPVIAQFEVELEAGLRLSRITGLADDLAVALRVPSVRIVAPLPGKNTVGIEVPNAQRQLVRLREVMQEADGTVQAMRIPIYLGKDVAGNPIVVDLTGLPHLLIAGRTGTGKSVCLNSIIASILMCRRPEEVRMLLIDPKMVELSPYKRIPHLMHPVVTDMRKAEAILAWAVEKMEERYQLLARAGVRHLSVYNQLGEEELMDRVQPADDEDRAHIPTRMPFIVIVADEMADLMMTAAKEVEGHIIRLAQKSRAVGIHLVLATQKPTVDVITGLIKSNLPARISFEVSSRTDSRVVLDEMGAEKLLGNGDLLFLRPGTSTLIRGQGTYLSDDEIARVIAAVATTEPQFVKELVQLEAGVSASGARPLSNRDELYEAAVDIVVREGRGSVSLLQRALGIGYGRAARLIDYMAEDGIVGPYNGSQAREILIGLEDWEAMRGRAMPDRPHAEPRRQTNKILLSRPANDGQPTTPRTLSAPVSSLKTEEAPWDGGDRAETPAEHRAWQEEEDWEDEGLDCEHDHHDEQDWEAEEDFLEDDSDDEARKVKGPKRKADLDDEEGLGGGYDCEEEEGEEDYGEYEEYEEDDDDDSEEYDEYDDEMDEEEYDGED